MEYVHLHQTLYVVLMLSKQPWTIKYRRAEEPESIQTVTSRSPNDYIRVKSKGLYELLEVGGLPVVKYWI